MRYIKTIFAVGLLSGSLFSSSAFAVFPTIDATNLAQAIKEVQHLKAQYDQMEREYDSFNGGRGMATLMRRRDLLDQLPGDARQVYDSMNNGTYDDISARANEILNSQDTTVVDSDERRQSVREAERRKAAQDSSNVADRLDQQQERLENLDRLTDSIDTDDPKAAADLQNRITAEAAIIQVESNKMELYRELSQAQDRLDQQQRKEMSRQITGAQNTKTPGLRLN